MNIIGKLVRFIIIFLLIFTFVTSRDTRKMEDLFSNQNYDEIISSENADELLEAEEVDRLLILVQSLSFQGQFDEALELVQSTREISDSLYAITIEHTILEALGNSADARELIEETISKYENEYTDLDIADQVNYNYILGKSSAYEKAIENYELLLEKNMELELEVTVLNNLAMLYNTVSDFDNTIRVSLLALEQAPEDEYVLTNLGNAYYHLEKYESAKEVYEKAYIANPYLSSCIYGLASTLEALNDDTSVKYWRAYTELLPMEINAWQSLKAHYETTGDLEMEIECAEAIFNILPNNYYYCFNLIDLYHQQSSYHKIEDAISIYKSHKTDYDGKLIEADYVMNYESKNEGLELYQKIFETKDYDSLELYYLLDSKYWIDDNEDYYAILDLLKAIYGESQLLPIEMDIYFDYSDYEMTMEVAQKLLEYEPNNAYVYEILGDCYYYKDIYNEAIPYYEKSLKLDGDNYYVKEVMADSLIFLGRTDEAIIILDQLLAEEEESNILHVYRARIDMINGNRDAAINELINVYNESDYLTYTLTYYEEFESLLDAEELKPYI